MNFATYSETVHQANCLDTTSRDPWLAAFLKLHVASDYESDAKFLQKAAAAVRSSEAVKKAKISKEAVVLDLLRRPLTPTTFYALALAYGVSVDVELGRVAFTTGCGGSGFVVKDGRLQKRVRFKTEGLLVHVNPVKPLYALSHYTVAELNSLCATAGLPQAASKGKAYERLKEYLEGVLGGAL
jgi:hypothetical protein